MNLPAALFAITWLIRDTFRQALAGRTFWVMLTVSLVCIVLCLSLSVERGPPLRDPDDVELRDPKTGEPLTGPTAGSGKVTLGFGLVNLAHLFDPDLILLGGGVTNAGDLVLGPARAIFDTYAMPNYRRTCRIGLAALGDDVGLYGAAAYTASRMRDA